MKPLSAARAVLMRAARCLCVLYLGVKSHYRSFGRLVLGALLPPLLLTAAFAAAGPSVAGLISRERLGLIFCDLEGSAFFDSLMNIMLSDESVRRTVSVRKLGYEDALGELSAGRADAVVVFPETFISDMAAGVNNPVQIYGAETDPIKSTVAREFMQSAAAELSAAQSAINTVWFNTDTQSMSEIRRGALFTSLVMEYTSKAFARSLYYTFQNTPPGFEGGSPLIFLLSSCLAALVFFGSLTGVKQIVAERALGINTRLRAAGMSRARVALRHFAPIYARQLLCACLAAAIALPAVAVAAKEFELGRAADEAMYGSERDAVSPIGSLLSGIGGEPSAFIQSADGSSADGASANDPGTDGTSVPADSGVVAEGALDGGGTDLPRLMDIPAVLKLTAEKAAQLPRVFGVIAVLCLLTSAIALFLGGAIRRAEPAEALVVTLGAAMAVAGGTLIPYPYLPEYFQSFGPFCFHFWAQKLIAAAYLAAPGESVWSAAADTVVSGAGVPWAVLVALLAAALFAGAVLLDTRD